MPSILPTRAMAVALRIAILSILFLTVLGGTALLIAWLLAWFMQTPAITAANLYVGMVCGLIVWLFVAAFHLRKETFSVPVPNRSLFREKIKTLLLELGYEVRVESSAQVSFRPGFQSYWLGSDVLVKLDGRHGTITGPRVCVEVLRNRLRIQNHLEKVYLEGRRRAGERLLRRAQLSFRVPADQWQDIHDHVVQVLASEAEVICELNVLAQSEKGLREHLVEHQVHEWLDQHGITVEVHKDPLYKEQESGIRNPESGIRNQDSGIRSQESAVRNQEPDSRSTSGEFAALVEQS
jgi:hypothetical protein